MKQTRTGSSKQKTARFDALVQSSGQPEAVTLWTKPEDDKAFMRAVREHRVLTLVQGNVGARKDFGLVGFTKQKNASYLVFPNRLALPPETKVVGIKYERLAATHPKGPVFKPARRRKPGIPMREQSRFTLEDEDHSPEKRSLKQSTNKSKAPY